MLLARARAQLGARNPQAALKDLNKATELDPKLAAGFAYRGQARAKLSQHDEALSDFARAIELDPRFVPAYIHRASTYRLMDQPETGLRDIERALKLEPRQAEGFIVRAELHEALGRKEEAIGDYRQSLALDVKLRESAEGLARLAGEASIEAQELLGSGDAGWRIFRRADGSYLASNAAHPRVLLTLEMAGAGEPRVLAWEEQPAAFKGIGVLRYEAGTHQDVGSSAPGQSIALAAVVDLSAARLISIEPDQIGDKRSKWSWDDGKLTVAGVDGLINEFRLRDQTKKAAVASAKPDDDDEDDRKAKRASKDGPAWAPWNEERGPSRRSERSAQQDRPSSSKKPKTLFDLLFN